MNTIKRIGIWMDHSTAHMMDYTGGNFVTENVESDFTHTAKIESLNHSENVMHNKEQHEQASYYKKLGERIKNYDEVLLFGPTDAKNELMNLLKADHHFDKIKFSVKSSEKMSENQQHHFIREHFEQPGQGEGSAGKDS